jgi:hypothetical protein
LKAPGRRWLGRSSAAHAASETQQKRSHFRADGDFIECLFSNITDNNQARLQAKDALGRWDLRVMNPGSSYGKSI